MFVYELNKWSKDLNAEFTLKNCLFGNVKITKKVDLDKSSYSRYVIRFDFHSLFSNQNFDWSKNVIIFCS